MGQHSSSGRGGRRRQESLHRHRAPAFPALFATRSRSALSVTALSATLAAGVGIAGVAASAAPVGGTGGASGPHTAAHAPAALPIIPPDGDEAPGKTHPRLEATVEAESRSAAPARRKTRPLPKAQWVHPLSSAEVTSCFGPRWGRLHAGVDLAAPHGARVVAAGAGVVISAGPNGGYGNAILIDHGNGWLTHYGHLSAIGVEVGQAVKASEHIGDEGSTGHSTGPHLHFEVHQGHFQNPVEPTAWMHEHGVEIPGCA
ncbi:M23 family metallopeptidase [Actinoplanes sp. NEAU-A12]|uniref:M23 family metallopeptidase n=1 Tax=Actinoplanes sandaracinus TaxID=3045177 RepID=A0ABT6WFE0_9ACTN|nr:M23 family metallopeptidase [Actinoplanes sandaracinus]MDI6098459.1 M23 family metallopeptidase [Actinoplanes sandaracinus]